MEEKDRYVYKTIDGYNFIVDTKTDERYFINKFLVGFFNRQDREINRLTKMLYTTVKHTDKLNEENNKLNKELKKCKQLRTQLAVDELRKLNKHFVYSGDEMVSNYDLDCDVSDLKDEITHRIKTLKRRKR